MTNQASRGNSAFGATADGRAFPRMDVSRKDPAVQAVLSKLVAPVDQNSRGYSSSYSRQNKVLRAPDQALLDRISDITAGNVSDAASIVQILPDLELAIQIMVSSILSPKDMVSTELNFSVESGQFNSELAGALIECVRDYFENTYKISELLPRILQDVLFYKGSYPLLILPESSIDVAINGQSRVAMESLTSDIDAQTKRPYHVGILGNGKAAGTNRKDDVFGFESFTASFEDFTKLQQASYLPEVGELGKGFQSHLSVTDNPNVLKMPMLVDKMRSDRLQQVLNTRGLAMESFDTNGGDNSLYRRRRYKHVPVQTMTPSNQLKRATVGHPLVMTLPAECVIPVHIPSNPEEHLGYFVLLDMQGNPLVKANETDYYNDLSTNLNANSDMVSQLVGQVKRNEQGINNGQGIRQAEAEELERIYADLVEEELMSRLKNGVYGESAQVSRPEEVYRIMFARSLARQQTQLLYVPAEMMTYIAFDYNKYGVGQSLLQGSKILGGLRAMLLFANTMAAIKNSVGRTLLNINLDPADPDPSTTVEFLLTEHARSTQNTYPLGATAPREILSFLQRAGVEVAVSGNAAYPETKLEVEDKQSNRAKPDAELEKSLKDRHLMSIGLAPETVDSSANAEFATTIVANNLLLAKRVLNYQRQLVSFIEDFIQKYTMNSGSLMFDLRSIFEENPDKLTKEQQRDKSKIESKNQQKPSTGDETPGQMSVDVDLSARPLAQGEEETSVGIDALVLDFIRAVRVTLPAPDTATLDNQMKAFDLYAEALDKAIKAYMDTSFLEGTVMGELAEVMEPTIAAVKAHFLRQWLRNNNVLSELDDLTTFTDEDGPAVDLMKMQESHLEGLGKSVANYMQRLLTARAKTDKTYADAKDKAGGGDAGGFGSDTTDNGGIDEAGAGAGGDGFSSMDVPGLDGLGGATEPAETTEETPPAEEETADESESTDEADKDTTSKPAGDDDLEIPALPA